MARTPGEEGGRVSQEELTRSAFRKMRPKEVAKKRAGGKAYNKGPKWWAQTHPNTVDAKEERTWKAMTPEATGIPGKLRLRTVRRGVYGEEPRSTSSHDRGESPRGRDSGAENSLRSRQKSNRRVLP